MILIVDMIMTSRYKNEIQISVRFFPPAPVLIWIKSWYERAKAAALEVIIVYEMNKT